MVILGVVASVITITLGAIPMYSYLGGLGLIGYAIFVTAIITFYNSFEIRGVKSSIDTLIETLKEVIPHSTIRATSPISITDIGHRIADTIGAESIVEKHLENISSEAKDKNAYEIQTICFEFAENKLFDLLDKEIQDKIDDAAYKNGFDRKDIMSILGVMMRKKLLPM